MTQAAIPFEVGKTYLFEYKEEKNKYTVCDRKREILVIHDHRTDLVFFESVRILDDTEVFLLSDHTFVRADRVVE